MIPTLIKLRNVLGTIINPATEEKQDAIITAIGGIGGSGSYATQMAEVGTTIYVGQAVPGSLTSSPVWQVQKIDTATGAQITFAGGSDSYSNIWDNYLSLIYS